MTDDEKILHAIEEMKQRQEAFIAEWRAAREEGKAAQARLAAERIGLKAASAATQRKSNFWLFVLFVAVLVLLLLR